MLINPIVELPGKYLKNRNLYSPRIASKKIKNNDIDDKSQSVKSFDEVTTNSFEFDNISYSSYLDEAYKIKN